MDSGGLVVLQIVGMLSLFALMAGIAAALVCGLIGAASTLCRLHRRRSPRELRGDWWSSFEEDFRAYASRRRRAADDDGQQSEPFS